MYIYIKVVVIPAKINPPINLIKIITIITIQIII